MVAKLEAKALTKSYKARQVVRGISLSVEQGEIVALLGPNGAGKTTTFYMICGLVQADSGSIHLDGKDVTKRPMHERAQMGLGYLPQEVSVFRKLTTADNIRAVLELRKDLDKNQREEVLDELLHEFKITHIRESVGMSLSGGEKRRVEIARALAGNPRFILLDEPFAGVDPISTGDIKEIVRHLADRGIGVLITDHDVRETLGICHRAYIVGEGELIAAGDPIDITENEQVRKTYLGESFRL